MTNYKQYVRIISKEELFEGRNGTTILLPHQLLREGFRCTKNIDNEGILIAKPEETPNGLVYKVEAIISLANDLPAKKEEKKQAAHLLVSEYVSYASIEFHVHKKRFQEEFSPKDLPELRRKSGENTFYKHALFTKKAILTFGSEKPTVSVHSILTSQVNYKSQTWNLRYVARLEHITNSLSLMRNIF